MPLARGITEQSEDVLYNDFTSDVYCDWDHCIVYNLILKHPQPGGIATKRKIAVAYVST